MILSDLLVKLLKKKNDVIYIQPHNFPDGDAIASSFGLQYFLKQYDIDSIICYKGILERLSTEKLCKSLGIDIVNVDSLTSLKDDDYIINIDSQKHNSNLDDIIGNEVACIDHHPTFIRYKYLYKDIRLVGSCSSIIASYYINANIDMPKNIATALMYGIQTDTANLTRGVKDLDIQAYSYLYKLADNDFLSEMSKTSLTIQDLKAYGTAIENIHIQNRIGFADIPFHCPDTLISKISDFILSLDEIDFSIVYSVRQNGLKISTRSKVPKVLDAGKITSSALQGIGSGGGHSFMAGGFIPKDSYSICMKDLKQEIINRFNYNITSNNTMQIAL